MHTHSGGRLSRPPPVRLFHLTSSPHRRWCVYLCQTVVLEQDKHADLKSKSVDSIPSTRLWIEHRFNCTNVHYRFRDPFSRRISNIFSDWWKRKKKNERKFESVWLYWTIEPSFRLPVTLDSRVGWSVERGRCESKSESASKAVVAVTGACLCTDSTWTK